MLTCGTGLQVLHYTSVVCLSLYSRLHFLIGTSYPQIRLVWLYILRRRRALLSRLLWAHDSGLLCGCLNARWSHPRPSPRCVDLPLPPSCPSSTLSLARFYSVLSSVSLSAITTGERQARLLRVRISTRRVSAPRVCRIVLTTPAPSASSTTAS